MFKCQVCGTQVPRGVPQKLVVVQSRPRVYSQAWLRMPNTKRNQERGEWRKLPRKKDGGRKNGKPRFIEVLIPNHTGWEIVKEERACPKCAAGHRQPMPLRRVA